jgi:hypothetical protein
MKWTCENAKARKRWCNCKNARLALEDKTGKKCENGKFLPPSKEMLSNLNILAIRKKIK